MLKKFLTLSLIFIFLLSTSGLPAILHICVISGSKSFVACNDCEDEKVVEEQDSCCETENSTTKNDETSFTKEGKVTCCYDQLTQIMIDDDFSITQVDKVQPNFVVVTTVSVDYSTEKNENYFLNDFDFVPESLFGKLLLKSIHQLKIDTPRF
jgi:hypothetical protein